MRAATLFAATVSDSLLYFVVLREQPKLRNPRRALIQGNVGVPSATSEHSPKSHPNQEVPKRCDIQRSFDFQSASSIVRRSVRSDTLPRGH